MSPTLLPNPSLVAVLLVVNTKSGPRFVFHYPPNARERVQPTATTWKDPFGDSLWEKGSEPSDPEDGSDDDEPDPHSSGTHQNGGVSISKAARARNRRDYEPDDQGDSSDDAQPHKVEGPAWESLFGFSTAGLEHILRVHKGFNKKKFELGVEPLVYLSYPLFMSEDGTWKKKRDKKAKKSKGKHDPVQRASFGSRDQAEASNKRKSTESRVDVGRLDNDLREMSLYDDPANEEDADDGQSVSSSEDVRAMSMFNMVFVMNPPQLEYQTRIDEMYEHVVKKFAKALKYEQARTNWVWQQSEMILNLKDKAKEDEMSMTKLWNLILVRSSLAKAMSEVFISISASKIAHVFLNDHFDVSLQIPQVQSIADLPSYIEPQMPGVWLTTADSFDEDEDSEHNTIAKHFALLLLDDVENIVRDINTEPGPPKISDPLVKFVRIVKPTMSFLEISNTHGMSLQTISALSRHLIYWRRARAIPPLHQRDKYIVSPNADMRALPAATRAYEKRFPTLPSLPKMLSLLSGHPRAYSTLIPSKDHRAAYLEILAWLLKGGWVTQLRVFAWVRVSSEIRAAVDAEIVKAEADAPADHDEGGNSVTPTISPALSSNTAPQIQHPSITTAAAAAAAASGASSRRASSGGSSTATVTNQPTFPSDPIPFPYDNDLLSSRRSDLVRPSPAAAAAAEPLIILDPHRANAVESRYLTAVGAALPTAELREEAWPILLRYLNGQHALEKIAVREGRRHKDIWRWLMAFEREGCLLTIRHW